MINDQIRTRSKNQLKHSKYPKKYKRKANKNQKGLIQFKVENRKCLKYFSSFVSYFETSRESSLLKIYKGPKKSKKKFIKKPKKS